MIDASGKLVPVIPPQLILREHVREEYQQPKSSITGLNIVIADLVRVQYVRFGFKLFEHDDWVHLGFPITCSENKKLLTDICFSKPLNSWDIITPVVSVPKEEELEKIAEWHRVLLYRSHGKSLCTPKAINILGIYIDNAFDQLEDLIRALSLWRKAKHPKKQKQCKLGSKKCFDEAISFQRMNVHSASETLKKIVNLLGPESVRNQFEAVYIREEKIYRQMVRVSRLLAK